MSQIFKRETAGTQPPQVPTQFNTDVNTVGGLVTSGGNAIPVANVLDLLARDTDDDNLNGIRTNADPNADNNVYVELTNRFQDEFGTTLGGSNNSVILTLDTTVAAVYTFEVRVTGIGSAGTTGAGFKLWGVFRGDGAGGASVATLIETVDKVSFKDVAPVDISDCDATLDASGNTVRVNITGSANSGISWGLVGLYTKVTV